MSIEDDKHIADLFRTLRPPPLRPDVVPYTVRQVQGATGGGADGGSFQVQDPPPHSPNPLLYPRREGGDTTGSLKRVIVVDDDMVARYYLAILIPDGDVP